MRSCANRALFTIAALCGLGIGAVIALFAAPDFSSGFDSLPAAALEEWPDASLDVCAVNLSKASLKQDAIETALNKLDGLKASELLELSQIPKSIEPNCGASPPFDPSVGIENVESSAPEVVDTKGKFDVYVYVYDSKVVERLGNTWLDRMAPQETLHEGDTYVPLASALFVSSEEFHDAEAMYRLLGRVLGLAGRMNPLRMTIDNECSEPGSKDCGPDVFAQE